MDTESTIRDYLEATNPGNLQLDRLRPLLTDDFVHQDPLMSVEGADAFVEKLRSVPPGMDAKATTEALLTKGNVGAALIRFEAGGTTVMFAQWLWAEGEKIGRVRVIYDPRPFFEMAGQQ